MSISGVGSIRPVRAISESEFSPWEFHVDVGKVKGGEGARGSGVWRSQRQRRRGGARNVVCLSVDGRWFVGMQRWRVGRCKVAMF